MVRVLYRWLLLCHPPEFRLRLVKKCYQSLTKLEPLGVECL